MRVYQGRIAVCNLAVTGTHTPVVTGDLAQRKLFIGSLSYDTTTETLINVFSQYGEIEEGSVAYDKATNKSRYRFKIGLSCSFNCSATEFNISCFHLMLLVQFTEVLLS